MVFSLDGFSPAEVARSLAGRGIYVSHGDFYATTAVRRMGHAHDGLVRIGCAIYTTQDEIERLVAGVQALVRS